MSRLVEVYTSVYFKGTKFPFTGMPAFPYIVFVPRKFGETLYSFLESFSEEFHKMTQRELRFYFCSGKTMMGYIEFFQQGYRCELVNGYQWKTKLPRRKIICHLF